MRRREVYRVASTINDVLPRHRALILTPRRSHILAVALPAIFFFMLAFPKGGVRVYDVPITFGYLLSPILLVWAALRAPSLAVPSDRLLAVLPALVMAVWSAVVVVINDTDSFGYTLSYFISAVYLPIFGLTFVSGLTLGEFRARMERTLIWVVRFTVAYGIFLFLYKIVTGQWIEIPYLTVNADDVGNLDSKFINRGSIYKLISTYNNGNIYGVAMCILAPLYLRLERSRVMVLAFYAALFLTLSRTVWIGAILVLVLHLVSNRLRVVTLLYLGAALLASVGAIAYILDLMGRDLSFIFDATLGNRVDQLNVLSNPQIIPTQLTTVLPEIVYTGVLANYGYPGLALFVVHLVTPPLLLLIGGVPLLSRSKASACLQGLLVYPVLAASDSAYNFPPVMMIFWMVAGWGFWYAQHERAWRGG